MRFQGSGCRSWGSKAWCVGVLELEKHAVSGEVTKWYGLIHAVRGNKKSTEEKQCREWHREYA